jgi:hypothetical protein
MLHRPRGASLCALVALGTFLILPLAASAGHGPGGQGKGHGGKGHGGVKVMLCHKGHTIRVGAPAARAHLRHGDTLGSCGHVPAPHTASLLVVKRVVNDDGGTKVASDFTLTIEGVTATGGNSFAGSESGVLKAITSFGSYDVAETPTPGYAAHESNGCTGMIAPGQQRICVVVNDDTPTGH